DQDQEALDAPLDVGGVAAMAALFDPPFPRRLVQGQLRAVAQAAQGRVGPQAALYLLGEAPRFDAGRAVKATTLKLEVIVPEAARGGFVDSHFGSVSRARKARRSASA